MIVVIIGMVLIVFMQFSVFSKRFYYKPTPNNFILSVNFILVLFIDSQINTLLIRLPIVLSGVVYFVFLLRQKIEINSGCLKYQGIYSLIDIFKPSEKFHIALSELVSVEINNSFEGDSDYKPRKSRFSPLPEIYIKSNTGCVYVIPSLITNFSKFKEELLGANEMIKIDIPGIGFTITIFIGCVLNLILWFVIMGGIQKVISLDFLR